jgi:hypothetical protein
MNFLLTMFRAILAFITHLALITSIALAGLVAERSWLWRLKRFIDVLATLTPNLCIFFIGLFI